MADRGLRGRGVVVRGPAGVLVAGLDVDVPAGGTLAVTGPGGSGLSTLLRVLAGVRPPDAGVLDLATRPLATADGSVRPDVGYVPQEHDLPGPLTAVENVAVPLLARGVRPAQAWQVAAAELTGLGLPDGVVHNLAEQLSGGQHQRVAVARALAGRPALLCLDEPFSELDERSADLVRQRLEQERARGAVVVLGTRDEADVAACDAVVVLPYVAPPGADG